MATRRNADGPTTTIDRTVPGLAARQVAHAAVADLLVQGRAFALEDALAQAGRDAGLDAADASLARAIATATFRRLGFLRRMLSARMNQGLPPDQPRLVALLVTGAVQILDLNVPDHAAVDLSVRLAKGDPYLQHTPGLVNAILRRVIREREAIAAEASDPLAQIRRTGSPLAGAPPTDPTLPEPSPRLISPAPRSTSRRVDRPRNGPIASAASPFPPAASACTRSVLRFRNSPDMLRGVVGAGRRRRHPGAPARSRAGQRVVDLCAAPGGKTAQLAAMGAEVVAVDRSAQRLERLTENLTRLDLKAEIRIGDATQLPESDADTFDAVLLDAPCSATGTIRRHPDVAWTKAGGDIGRLAGLQRRLLDRAATLVKPGGRLVYCTCSLEPEEGEGQVAAFLARNPAFARLPIRVEEIGGLEELINGDGDLRTLPSHLSGETAIGEEGPPAARGGIDGFFASRLVRKA